MIFSIFWRELEKEIISQVKYDVSWLNLNIVTTGNDLLYDNEIIKANWNNIELLANNSKIVFFDDVSMDDYIRTKSKSLWMCYNMINPIYGAMRADFFRYFYIYIEGGLYLDVKSGICENIFANLDDNVHQYLSHWYLPTHKDWGMHKELDNHPEFVNWFILSKAGNPNLLLVIENMTKKILNYCWKIDGLGSVAILRTTGPIIYTKTIRNSKIVNYKVINYGKLGLYYSVFELKKLNFSHRLISNHYKNLNERIVLGSIFNRYCNILFYLFIKK